MSIFTDTVNYSHNVSGEATETFALHCHPMHEVYYFVRGDVRYLVEGVTYAPQPHSLLLMASGVFHGIRILSDAPYERHTLHFDEACLPEAMRAALLAPFRGAPYYENVDAFGIDRYFDSVEACEGMDTQLADVAVPVRIAALLTQLCYMRAQTVPRPSDEGVSLERQIVAHINAHLTEPLSLEGIAKDFFISRNQLCRSFARATGTTVGAYIRQKRLILAQRLRVHGQSAAEAAVNAGFGDYSTYYRTHVKLLGCAPTTGGEKALDNYTYTL